MLRDRGLSGAGLAAAFIALACEQACMSQAVAAEPAVKPLVASVTVATPFVAGEAMFDGAAVALSIDAEVIAALRPARRAIIEQLPIAPNLAVALDLKRIEPFTDDARIVVATGMRGGRTIEQALPMPTSVFFGGSVVGMEDSQAFLALSEDVCNGWVRAGDRMYMISSGPHGLNQPLLAFDLAALPEGLINFDMPLCETDALAPVADPAHDHGGGDGGLAGSGAGAVCREVKVAIETDYEFTWMRFGGNPIAAANYAATIMAATNFIYTRDLNVRLPMSYLRLWTTPDDPWTATGSSSQLSQFRTYWNANMQSVPRVLAHMFSARGLGGGVAWLSVMCDTSYGYAFSGSLNGSFPYPIQNNSSQNWDIMVVAHEKGHNFSSPHTHSYNPVIDGCGLNPQDCTDANQGTIMSYCHTCSGGMSNIVVDMHPVVEARILTYLDGLTCNYVGSNLPPVAGNDHAWVIEGGTLTLDVLANDLETNCDSVVIDAFSSSSAQGGVVSLSTGTGPEGRNQLQYVAPTGYNGLDTFTYTIRDAGNQTSSATVTVRVYGYRAAANPVRFQSGVRTRYYQLNEPSILPDYSAITPYAAGAFSNVNFASTNGNFAGSGLADNVGAVFTGWVNVTTPGLYTFYLTSDDGSLMRVGDEVVVGNDGLHGMIERSGVIALLPGRHKVRIEFFEYTGGAGLIARYSGPGLSKQIIPASAWSRALPADVNEDGSVNVSDLLMVIGQWGACVAGCEADTNADAVIDVTDLLAVIADWG